MVCRGKLPITIHFYGLTAAHWLPNVSSRYRPTYRFLPAG